MSMNVLKSSEKSSMQELVEIMARLRGPNGCPWDREQSHLSLRPNLVEETYEVLEAIDNLDMPLLQEELGDLLLQIVFHAQLASEAGFFDIDEVIKGINAKLIRRHPHIFGETKVDGVAGVLEKWEQIKQQEKKSERNSALDGVPKDLPALQRADKYQRKAAKVGFDWDQVEGPLAKVKEEIAELEEVLHTKLSEEVAVEAERLEDEFGDILFSMVNLSRFLKVDAELALRRSTDKFNQRFRQMEQLAKASGQQLSKLTLEEMDELWEKVKSTARG